MRIARLSKFEASETVVVVCIMCQWQVCIRMGSCGDKRIVPSCEVVLLGLEQPILHVFIVIYFFFLCG